MSPFFIGGAKCCCEEHPPPPCVCCAAGSQIEIDLSGWSLSGATPSWPVYSVGAAAAAFGRAFFEEFIGSVLIWNETESVFYCDCYSGYSETRNYDSDERFSIDMSIRRNFSLGGGIRGIQLAIKFYWIIGPSIPFYLNSHVRIYRAVDAEQADCSGSADLPFYELLGGDVHPDMQQFDWYTSGQVAPVAWYPSP
ncbi:MAG: hypothetical protein E6R04_09020 [Spirochaetes bacterium]|nr:MAG: hypothetical protein E6R04_09020 [Spirochaetota bacterium]